MEFSTLLWLVAAAMAQSAIAMSVYFIHMSDPMPDQPFSLSDILVGRMQSSDKPLVRLKRAAQFDGIKSFDTNSWFPWRGDEGKHLGSATGFHHFRGFHDHPHHEHDEEHHHGGHHEHKKQCCTDRIDADVGEKFIVKLEEVPEETRDEFYAPEDKTPEARRERYGVRAVKTPPHAYRIAKVIPFFDTLDHKSVMITLINFRDHNKIPVLKLLSIRPYFPFFVKT